MPLGREFCSAVQSIRPWKTVLEVGSRPAEGQEEIANLRTVFTTATRYLGVDALPGPGVDRVWDFTESVVGGADFPWKLDEFELCVSIDMLEHCRRPEDAVFHMSELAGNLALRTAFCAPIHNHPVDYWRFTPAILKEMVSEHYEFGFVAQDAPVVSVPSSEFHDWPHGVYAFGTMEESLRDALIVRLRARPKKDIMMVSAWGAEPE